MFDWRRPGNLGVKDGRLAPPRRTPNCVSSQADPADREHYIAPIAFTGEAIPAVRVILDRLPDVKVISQERDYLYAEFRTRLLRFVDDVEFFHDAAAGLVHVRSASRLGRRDFHVNRNRVEMIRRLMSA
jgi:uncharacterized protein (DUF1499 family)